MATTFAGLAGTVDALARALETDADLFQAIADNMDHFHAQARAGATRNRRLAGALREAARWFAADEVPPEDVREIIDDL